MSARRLLARHRRRGAAVGASARERQSAAAIEARAAARGRPARPSAFATRCRAPGVRVIAECKRRSPSRGVLRADYDPAAIARGYERAGAAAISVLTEPTFFDGSLDHLRAVRARVSVPLLRKDFIVTEFQIVEAAAAAPTRCCSSSRRSTDAELRARLRGRRRAAASPRSSRCTTATSSTRALDAGATLVGVNSRNLRTLEVRTALFDELAPSIPPGVVAVAESGLKTADDLARLRRLRFDAFLIGERFMTEADPGAALAQLTRAAATKLDADRSTRVTTPASRSAASRGPRTRCWPRRSARTRIGFVFWPSSPRVIAPANARARSPTRCRRSSSRVGVFVNATADEVRAIVAQAGLDVAATARRRERDGLRRRRRAR